MTRLPSKKPLVVLLSLIFVLTVIIYAYFNLLDIHLSHAAQSASTWVQVKTPKQGIACDWLLAEGSDVIDFKIADDGMIAAIVRIDGTQYHIFISHDNGSSWNNIPASSTQLLDISISKSAVRTVFFTDGIEIYKMNPISMQVDTVEHIPVVNPDTNVRIQSIDVVTSGELDVVLAGIVGPDNSSIYSNDMDTASCSWKNLGSINGTLMKAAFSPSFNNDKRVILVIGKDTDTQVMTAVIENDEIQDYTSALIPGCVPETVRLAYSETLPSDMVMNDVYIAVDSLNNRGDVYKAHVSVGSVNLEDLDIGSGWGLSDIDVSAVAVGNRGGTEYIYAGLAAGSQVYYSTDGGGTWVASQKQPSGKKVTCLGLSSEFAADGKVYASTSGYDSAFSCSIDSGSSYDQIAIIDTTIGNGCIIQLAVSPSWETDTTLYLLTMNEDVMDYSVWKSATGGQSWIRVQCSSVCGLDYIRDIVLSPEFGSTGNVLYIAGKTGTNPVMLRSIDGGQTSEKLFLPFDGKALSVIENDVLYAAGSENGKGIIYRSDDGGKTWSTGSKESNYIIESITCSPNYAVDGTIIVAHLGYVYYSDDFGSSFHPLPSDSGEPPFQGRVSCTFDRNFQTSHMIFVASDAEGEGLFRFVIGQDTAWEKIDAGLPSSSCVTEVTASDSGVLYALNSDRVDTSNAKGGVERSLNPSFHLLPTFQTLDKGLNDGMHLTLLKINANRLWAIDATTNTIFTYHDSMTVPVELLSPLDGYPGMEIRNVIIDWATMEGATEYEWQVDYSGYFSTVPYGFEGYTTASSIRLPELETDTTYHWRVRATKPVLSPWSEIRTFTTTLGESLICPNLLSPGAGAELSSREPLFQWSAIAGAEKYELMVSEDSRFTDPVIEKSGRSALPATAWQSDIALDEGETYFWKVRALGSGSNTRWSAVSAFVTSSDPVPQTVIPEVNDTVHIASYPGPVQLSPTAGCIDVSGQPLFQWESVSNADGYELLVASDQAFTDPVITRAGEYAIPVTAWSSNIDLDTSTVYYWKVRAVIDSDYSDWSPVGIFLTESEPLEPAVIQQETETEEDTQPETVVQQVPEKSEPEFPVWIVYAGLGLLITIVLLQITMLLVLIVTRTRSY